MFCRVGEAGWTGPPRHSDEHPFYFDGHHGSRAGFEGRAKWVRVSSLSLVMDVILRLILDRVTDLRPQDTQDAPFYYTFKVQCTSCREIHPNLVSVSRFEQNEMSGSRGEANFVWKCKNCKVTTLSRLLSAIATAG